MAGEQRTSEGGRSGGQRQRNTAKGGQGTQELLQPGPFGWEFEVVVTRRADQPTGDAEQPTAQRLQALDAQPCQPRQPAAEVVGDDVAGRPGGVRGELDDPVSSTPRSHWPPPVKLYFDSHRDRGQLHVPPRFDGRRAFRCPQPVSGSGPGSIHRPPPLTLINSLAASGPHVPCA